MKTVCKGGEINFDELNKFDPDGSGPFCSVAVAGYGSDVPAAEKGRFLITSDNGRVNCADLALKLLLDMCLRTGVPGLRYLKSETARGCEMYSNGARELSYVQEGSPMLPLMGEIGASCVMLPETSLCVQHNFGALHDYDIVAWMAGQKGAARASVEYLNDYIWLGREARTFTGLCGAVTCLLSAMSTDDVRIFLEGFYEALEPVLEHEAEQELEYGAQDEDGGPDNEEAIDLGAGQDDDVDGGSEDDVDEREIQAAQPADDPKPVQIPHMEPAAQGDGVIDAFNNGSIKVKGLSSKDITGLDETYACSYFDESYTRELNIRDSEGLFDSVLKARINGTPAPVDVLSEVVSEQTGRSSQAGQLRSKMADLSEEISSMAATT